MINRIIVFLIALCFSTSVTQATLILLPELRGTVTDSIIGSPISGVVVTLVNKKMSDTTDAQGKYGFIVPTRVEYSTAGIISGNSLVGNHLMLNISKTMPVTVELFNASGKKMSTLLKDENLSSGTYDVNLLTSGVAAGLYMVRVRQGGQYWVHQYLPIQGNVMCNSGSSRKAMAKKSDATILIIVPKAIDTLVFSKTLYGTMKHPISYDTGAFNPVLAPLPAVTDIDGNEYHAITIGTQVWTVENLKTTRYNDGTAIPFVTDNTIWGNVTTAAYCWYNNDLTNKTPYGALYNWYAVNTVNKLAPTGWHVPSDAEWSVLVAFVGGDSSAGGVLKEAGTTHWSSPNIGATNNPYGFSALPGAFRFDDGAFYYFGSFGGWWSSTPDGTTYSWYRSMYYDRANADRGSFRYGDGLSVRCVKDP